MRTPLLCFWVSLFFAVSTSTTAAPADLDPRWGANGIASAPGIVGTIQLMQDGDVLAAIDAQRIVRFKRNGSLDTVFGASGSIIAPAADFRLATFSLRPDGWIDALWVGPILYAGLVPECNRIWARYTAAGIPDQSFGTNGTMAARNTCLAYDLTATPDGHTYWRDVRAGAYSYSNWITHFDARDQPQPDIGASGATVGGGQNFWVYSALTVDWFGLVVVGGTRDFASTFGFRRFRGPSLDPTFGTDGNVELQLPGYGEIRAVTTDRERRVIGAGLVRMPGARFEVGLVRLMPNGLADETFGYRGISAVSFARMTETYYSRLVLLQLLADGSILVAADVASAGPGSAFRRVGIARLLPDGQPDPRFAGAGIASLSFDGGFELASMAVRPTGEILLAGRSITGFVGPQPQYRGVIAQLEGGDLPAPHLLKERTAVEYFHAAYGHYFLTADAEEIAGLDTSPGRGWARTGRTINVWDDTSYPLKPVCRFWSDQTWAPKSSHFYTPYEQECAIVKGDPAWRFEPNTFMLRLPEGVLGSRTCPSGSAPLYRAYNNGLTGAPNHRYMTDPALLDEMMAQGWSMEGEAQTSVFACVPAQ